MRQDGRLDAAKNAAGAFLDTVPDDVEVAFNQTVTRLVEPTTQHEQVRQAVAGLEADGDTALYDAVIDSLSFLGSEGLRSLVLLSDGENDAPLSPTTIEQAESTVAAQAGNVDMTIVGIGTTPGARSAARSSGYSGRTRPRQGHSGNRSRAGHRDLPRDCRNHCSAGSRDGADTRNRHEW